MMVQAAHGKARGKRMASSENRRLGFSCCLSSASASLMGADASGAKADDGDVEAQKPDVARDLRAAVRPLLPRRGRPPAQVGIGNVFTSTMPIAAHLQLAAQGWRRFDQQARALTPQRRTWSSATRVGGCQGSRTASSQKQKAEGKVGLAAPEGPRSNAADRPSATQVPYTSSVASGKRRLLPSPELAVGCRQMHGKACTDNAGRTPAASRSSTCSSSATSCRPRRQPCDCWPRFVRQGLTMSREMLKPQARVLAAVRSVCGRSE